MEENSSKENSFIGYEYKDILVQRNLESLYADGFVNFGWNLENVSFPLHSYNSIIMRFKRDRKIRNKMELTRLQRQFESCAAEVNDLEKSKIIVASAVAYITGLVGTAFIAGSIFSYLGGSLALCIILAIPGFAGWVIPYFAFLALRNKKTAAVDPLIEKKYDEMYEVCEKANSLLAN